MTRLPSRRNLQAMSESGRWSILSALARDLREELHAFDAGMVVSVNGAPIAQHRRNVRRKLTRVYSAADQFAHYVGQPVTCKASDTVSAMMVAFKAKMVAAIKAKLFDTVVPSVGKRLRDCRGHELDIARKWLEERA